MSGMRETHHIGSSEIFNVVVRIVGFRIAVGDGCRSCCSSIGWPGFHRRGELLLGDNKLDATTATTVPFTIAINDDHFIAPSSGGGSTIRSGSNLSTLHIGKVLLSKFQTTAGGAVRAAVQSESVLLEKIKLEKKKMDILTKPEQMRENCVASHLLVSPFMTRSSVQKDRHYPLILTSLWRLLVVPMSWMISTSLVHCLFQRC